MAKDKVAIICTAVLSMLLAAPAHGQTVDFKGKQIKLLIGYGPGGGYDQYGRLVAAHIGRHLPGNPTVLPQNMPGGGSLLVAQKIYAQSPKDGTEWGIVARDVITAPLTQPNVARMFDATKYSWLGSADFETNICIANASTGIKSPQDLFRTELVVGATGPGAGSYIYPIVLNGLIGTRFKVVSGYPTSTETFLAMERHEVEGACDSFSSIMRKSAQAIRDGKIRVIFWAGHEIPDVKDLPHVTSFVTKAEDRELIDFMYAGQTYARPFVAPPDLPAPIHTALANAFVETLKDPQTIADAARQALEIRPVGADETLETVKKAYATPAALIDRMSGFLKDGGR